MHIFFFKKKISVLGKRKDKEIKGKVKKGKLRDERGKSKRWKPTR
jgi:hypothetical protein